MDGPEKNPTTGRSTEGLAVEHIQRSLRAFDPGVKRKILLQVAELLGLDLHPETKTAEV